MDDDFLIDLVVPNGMGALAPLLSQAPFEMVVGRQADTPFDVLVQSAVSAVAGFGFSGVSGDVQHYECSVCPSHPGQPEVVLFALSSLFKQAGLSHRIARLIIELDQEEELVSYVAGA